MLTSFSFPPRNGEVRACRRFSRAARLEPYRGCGWPGTTTAYRFDAAATGYVHAAGFSRLDYWTFWNRQRASE